MPATLETILYCGGQCLASDGIATCGSDGEKCGLCPLAHFYNAANRALPTVWEVGPAEIPQPYRQLLVHERDMTSTMEKFHGGRTHLRVLRAATRNGVYEREVVLVLDGTNRPVEFGALTVHLDLLPATVRDIIVAGERPFGGVLVEHNIPFSSHPKAFIRVEPDAVIGRALGLTRPVQLYGRCNALYDAQGRVLADIVEILPPAERRSGAMEEWSSGVME
jgi:chorismate-pyruvate lyase